MRIRCTTKFDCSATGITGHYRASQVPFQDKTGRSIVDQRDWARSRNQQRNWETLLQIIGLRCQPEHISDPVKDHTDRWLFEFDVEVAGLFDDGSFVSLMQDCDAVPMLTGLDDTEITQPLLKVSGPDQNIWFETLNI